MAGMLEISDEEFKSNYAFPGGSVVKNLPANAEDLDLIPGARKSPGEENGKPLLYSSLENPTDRGAWWATVLGVTKESTATEKLNNNNNMNNMPRTLMDKVYNI